MSKETGKKMNVLLRIADKSIEYILVCISLLYIGSLYSESGLFETKVDLILLAFVLTLVYAYLFSLISTMNYSISETLYGIGASFMIITMVSHLLFSRLYEFNVIFQLFFEVLVIETAIIFIWKILMKLLEKTFKDIETIILIGSEQETKRIAKKMFASKKEQVKIIGIYTEINEDLFTKIDSADKVLVGNSVYSSIKQELINHSLKSHKKIYLIPEIYEIAVSQSKLVQFDDTPVFEIKELKLSKNQKRRKRLFDFIASLTAIIIFSPILLIVAIIIKAYDRGPIMFSQLRLTEDGREFYVHKFRSMIVDAEKLTGAVLATNKDPRITPLGRILRATRLDELPQFFNVFKGEMSLVGPRPERPVFFDQFEETIPEFRQRLIVQSGITGLAQTLSNYTTTPEDKLIYDLQYIREYSFILDLKIIFQTVRIAFTKESSAGFKDDSQLDDEYMELIKTIN